MPTRPASTKTKRALCCPRSIDGLTEDLKRLQSLFMPVPTVFYPILFSYPTQLRNINHGL